VAIAVEYLGPLQVAWYKEGELKADDAYQTLSFRDFGETNKVWHPMNAVIINTKGEVQVHFSKVEAAHAKVPPKNLYDFGK